MKTTATVLCNNILVRAKEEKIRVTPMKLQKLLYYVCVKYAKETGDSPVLEPFEVWKFGPVVSSVYVEFKSFSTKPITGYARDAKGEAMKVSESRNPILAACLNYVWNKLKHYNAVELSERTHQKGSGWYAAYQEDRQIITLEDMKNDRSL